MNFYRELITSKEGEFLDVQLVLIWWYWGILAHQAHASAEGKICPVATMTRVSTTRALTTSSRTTSAIKLWMIGSNVSVLIKHKNKNRVTTWSQGSSPEPKECSHSQRLRESANPEAPNRSTLPEGFLLRITARQNPQLCRLWIGVIASVTNWKKIR